MKHAPGFLKLVNEARPYVNEISVEETRVRLESDFGTTVRRLPGRYWSSVAAVTAVQAFGTDLSSPGWNVVTSESAAGGGLG